MFPFVALFMIGGMGWVAALALGALWLRERKKRVRFQALLAEGARRLSVVHAERNKLREKLYSRQHYRR